MKNKRKPSNANNYILSGIFFLSISSIFMVAARFHPTFAQWYSTHIYPIFVSVIGRLSSMVSFSFVELSLYVMSLLIIGTGIHALASARKNRKTAVLQWISALFLGACILFFLFVINCGINYQKESFADTAGLKVRPYSVEELTATCQWLTEEVSRLSAQVQRSDQKELLLPDDIQKEAVGSMQSLGRTYPSLQGYYPAPKPVPVSEILSRQKLMGIYSPFTIEANYNQDMPAYDLPFTMCHELSHLRGFMQEEEANFISFLACRASALAEFQYSGTLCAWEYVMGALYRADPDIWQEVRNTLDPSAEPDLKADDVFWAQYDGRIAEAANLMNDTYLKANGQTQGVQSYGQMTDLLVIYYLSYFKNPGIK
ncbi:DUF3810 domain-containing protein [Mediterraneibacter gnavus]|uniref:DUF3810 domain-containing protein n=1 Tax=Mediterraneibacter gnavus TaxID=33038 RepID=UPI0004640893|nr:DUF3810 domain-containing protein [Mediterraneibacter gnavus]